MAHTDHLNQPKLDMTKEEKEKLKYLEFVQAATVKVVARFAMIYTKAKDKSGRLKPVVESIEGAVKTVMSPVYQKYHNVPVEVLKYMDHKVDIYVNKLDHCVPSLVKQVSTQAISAAQIAPRVARDFASEVRRVGVTETTSRVVKSVYSKYEPTAKELYASFEPKAEQCVVWAWKKLNKLLFFPRLVRLLIPTTTFCFEKYNDIVMKAAKRGFKVSLYMPLVPMEKISKIFAKEMVPMEKIAKEMVPMEKISKIFDKEMVPMEKISKIAKEMVPMEKISNIFAKEMAKTKP